MNTITYNTNEVLMYWNLLQNLTDNVKTELISKLTASLSAPKTKVHSTEEVVDFISKEWPEDGLSADEFVNLCESGRTTQREFMEF